MSKIRERLKIGAPAAFFWYTHPMNTTIPIFLSNPGEEPAQVEEGWYVSLPEETKLSMADVMPSLRKSSWLRRYYDEVKIAAMVGMGVVAIPTTIIIGSTLPMWMSSAVALLITAGAVAATCLPFCALFLYVNKPAKFMTFCSQLHGYSIPAQSASQVKSFYSQLEQVAKRGGAVGKAAIQAIRLFPVIEKRRELFNGIAKDQTLLSRIPSHTQTDTTAIRLMKEKIASQQSKLAAVDIELNKLALNYTADAVRVDVAENLEGYLLSDKTQPTDPTPIDEPDHYSNESGRLKTAVSLEKVSQS